MRVLTQAGASGQPRSVQTLAYNPASQLVSLVQADANYVWAGRPPVRPAASHDGLNRDAAIAVLADGYDARGNLTNDGTRRFA